MSATSVATHVARAAVRLASAKLGAQVRFSEALCLCGGDAYRVLGAAHEGAQPFTIARCLGCRLVRIVPVPDPMSLYCAGYQDSMTVTGEYLVRDKPWCRTIAEAVAALVSADARLASAPLLDVGCNGGELVQELAALGLSAEGCDVDPVAVAHGQSLGLSLTRKDLCAEPVGTLYSVIILNHTLEHVVPIYALLRSLFAGLIPGGILYVRVPNFGGWIARVMGERWSFLVPRQHVWQFTPETLQRHVLAAAPYEARSINCRASMEYSMAGWKGRLEDLIKELGVRFDAGDEIIATFRRPLGSS
jgi:2-polyprenyl-3-methyl-5-hydroxy-6-metoxy-1,4-benzoquinol methylase